MILDIQTWHCAFRKAPAHLGAPQMSFAIGVTKRGIPGGLLSGILFQYPGLVMMTVLGAVAAKYLVHPAAWLQAMAFGFGSTGVALVAGAAVALLTKLCPTRTLQASAQTLIISMQCTPQGQAQQP